VQLVGSDEASNSKINEEAKSLSCSLGFELSSTLQASITSQAQAGIVVAVTIGSPLTISPVARAPETAPESYKNVKNTISSVSL
jgi:hypothetical protein